MKRYAGLLLLCAALGIARPPATLPGDELSNDTYLNYMINNSLTEEELDILQNGKKEKVEVIDTNALFSTWSAPSIADQIPNPGSFKLGMGAIFVPRMSEEGAIEPDILIKNSKGEILHSGETGKKFHLLPGKYTLHIGNLAKLQITKEVYVEEGKITPVIPDWCGLRIEVVDENAKPVRGEYDLASLNPLEPIGRGRGRDIDLAEDIRIWFLPVGTYKILGPGASLNSISNFLTVRLTNPGEFIRYTIVQDGEGNDTKILGGGILIEDAEQHKKDRLWTHNINVGGSVDFNFVNNEDTENDTIKTDLSLLLYDRFNLKKNKLEVNNLVKVDMSLNMDKFRITSLQSSVDELRITSLFTYRLIPRLGPYARGEYISGILPKSKQTEDVADKDIAPEHAFIFYDEIPQLIDDSSPTSIDETSESVRISPAFSPLNLQAGTGFNFQVFRNRIINTRFLSGFGIAYENRRDSWEEIPEDSLRFDTSSAVYKEFYTGTKLQTSLYSTDFERLDVGPELMLNSNLYLGRLVSLDNEVKFFFPFERINRPDITIRNLLSLHLTGNIIIDYDYEYQLVQAEEVESQKDVGRHRILFRVSFSR